MGESSTSAGDAKGPPAAMGVGFRRRNVDTNLSVLEPVEDHLARLAAPHHLDPLFEFGVVKTVRDDGIGCPDRSAA